MKFWWRLVLAIVLAGIQLWSNLPVFASNQPNTADYIQDHILVKFKMGVNALDIQATNSKYGTSLEKEMDRLNVQVIKVPEGQVMKQVEAYRNDPNVEYAEPDYILKALDTPDDPSFGDQWGMTQIQEPEAWNITYGNSDIIIAILDTGIDQDHEDLAAKIITNKNFTTSSTVDDLYGHGTHVAGIAAAITNNGTGVAGAGYNSRLMNVKVLDDDGNGSVSTVADGIEWASKNGAKVINLSLGGSETSDTLQKAVDEAWKLGVVIVAAAGNKGSSTPFYPANCNHCVAVAATDQNDAKASFSNYGAWVDVAAPGVDIYSTFPNHAFEMHDTPNNCPSDYGSLAGTSMAAPFVSGLAALVWSTSYGADNQAVVNRIYSTVDQINGTGTNWEHGRINAYKAVSDNTFPCVSTLSATKINTTTATLQGNLIYKGNASTVNVSFQWGTNKGGPYTNTTSSHEKTTTGAFSTDLSGLTPNTIYHFRAKAEGTTTVYGSEKTFTTWATPITGRIAYCSSPQDNDDIYIMNADGTNQIQLTVSPLGDSSPSLSSGGTKITYSAAIEANHIDIFIMNADGSNKVNLTDNPSLNGSPVWSPDGNRIAFVSNRDGNNEIYVINIDGSGIIQITDDNSAKSHLAWSPDGTRIAYDSDGINIINADGTNKVRLHDGGHPTYSPDGTKMAFVLNGICTMDADGSNQIRLCDGFDPVYSPDGTKIAFILDNDIYVMNFDGSNPTKTTSITQNYQDIDWESGQINPSVSTNQAESIAFTEATLNGSLTSMGLASSGLVSFEWGTDTNYGRTTTPQALSTEGDFKSDIIGLSPYTTYHFRAKADGGDYGVAYGEDMTFKTKSISPVVIAASASSISSSVATVSGTLEDLGDTDSVKVSFEYGTSTSYGKSSVIQTLLAPGDFSATLTSLKSDTVYHFRIKAEGKATVYSQDNTFTTLPPPLGVTTSTPSGVSTTTATLRGSLSGLGDEASVYVYFEWGLTTGYGNTTAPQVLDKKTDFSAKITSNDGLAVMKTYHYRAVAEGSSNKVYGDDKSFVAKTAVSSGGGGGGGSISVPRLMTVTLSGLTSTTVLKVDAAGAVQESVELKMDGGGVSLSILKNTKLTDSTGKALKIVTAANLISIPEPAPQYAIILGYEFGPAGAKFDPAPVLTFKYDPQMLPAGVTEDKLHLAYWDGTQWVNLESTLDKGTSTISAKINHFSDYALTGELPPPAKFDLSNFSISKEIVNTGEPVTIHTLVTNIGGSPGENDIVLKIDDKECDRVKVKLTAGEFQNVVFQVIKDASGEYNVDVNGQTGRFIVAVPQPIKPEFSPETQNPVAETTIHSNIQVPPVSDNPQPTSQKSSNSSPILWSMLIVVGILGFIGGLVIVRGRKKPQ